MENIAEILQLAPAEAVKKLKSKAFTPVSYTHLSGYSSAGSHKHRSAS